MYKRHIRFASYGFCVALGLGLLGCHSSDSGSPATSTAATGSGDAGAGTGGNGSADALDCLHSSTTHKEAYFGDLHIHTKLSFDAYFFNSLNGPKEAYDFAKGTDEFEPGGDDPNTPVKRINIGRPLDFAAVTEHAEQMGTFSTVCEANGNLPDGTNPACSILGQYIRNNIGSFITGNAPLPIQVATSVGRVVPSTTTWQNIQKIAEDEYQPCKFTTFHAYEFSSNKGGQVLHRNVIFNDVITPKDVYSSVPPLPSADNTNDEWGLFDSLKSTCLSVAGCDVITIPHSTNQSDGRFARPREPDTNLPLARNNAPLTLADAQLRNQLDRLFEIIQHKGGSECITGFNTALTGGEESGCGFEEWKTLCRGEATDPAECKLVCKGSANDPLFCQVNHNHGSLESVHASVACTQVIPGGSIPADCTSPLDYARNVIPEGTILSRLLGVNPYQYGFIASTDTHNGVAGNTDKHHFAKNPGHGGVLDNEPPKALGHWSCRPPATPLDGIVGTIPGLVQADPTNPQNCSDRFFDPVGSNFTPGGLAGVWARENTRKEIFAALKRRETFGTSGSRMRIRTLASTQPFPADICDRLAKGESPIEEGVVSGVPQGGSLTVTSGGPYIVAYALQDPGGETPGIPLQKLELIKTWADSANQVHEQKFVLGQNASAPTPAADCSLQYTGPERMCAVFHDTSYSPTIGASYYARALENTSCRWTTLMCTGKGIQCSGIQASNGLFPTTSTSTGYEGCCSISGTPGTFLGQNRFITQQERAWSSPIWVQGTPVTSP